MELSDIFDAHLNALWLRPESVVWDTAASWVLREHRFTRPSLDLGSGNGLFSFLTAGGRLEVDFDWFVHTDAAAGGDVYDTGPRVMAPPIVRAPAYRIDVALDYKPHLLDQAAVLDLYERTVVHDAATPLPFPDGEFATVFSNILNWVERPQDVLRECARVLAPAGQAILCVASPLFIDYCESYRWRDSGSEWLRLVNGQRGACLPWAATRDEFEGWVADAGLRPEGHDTYLRRHTLSFWDAGLRPLSKPLIRLVNGLSSEARAAFKQEWIAAARPLLWALLEEELRSTEPGGFQLFVLRRA